MSSKRSEIIVGSLLNAVGVLLYVLLVSWFLSNAERVFGSESKGVFVPVFMLLLLIVSATITGTLVLGKPILWYLGGRKQDALALFFATLGWLVVCLFSVVVVLILR